ncbi:hypothetical protein FBU30_003707 [Linnemannia zychae]|nr:hypothetical protein FBU30_003707 [Linnemannia zychae]
MAYRREEWPFSQYSLSNRRNSSGQQQESNREIVMDNRASAQTSRSALTSIMAISREDHQNQEQNINRKTNNSASNVASNGIESLRVDETRQATPTQPLAAHIHRSEKTHKNAQYRLYQSHWKEWCIRKEYSDGDWVTREKFIAYARELMAPQPYTDLKTPRLSIKPLFVRSYDKREIRRPSSATVGTYLRAVRSLYKDQCFIDGTIPNLHDDLGRAEVDAITKGYEKLLKQSSLKKVDDAIREEVEHNDDDNEDDNSNNDSDNDRHDDNDDDDDDRNSNRDLTSSREESPQYLTKQTEYPSASKPERESAQRNADEQDRQRDTIAKKINTKDKRRALSPISQKKDRHFIFAGTTQRHHLSHQTQWKEWCIRKRYEDRHRVTPDKVIAFAKEITAREEYYDKDNPHLCIRPFVVNIHKGSQIRRASKNTVRACLTAIRALYLDQCYMEKVTPNLIEDLAKSTVDAILNDYEKLLLENPGVPPVIYANGQGYDQESEIQEILDQEGDQQEAVEQRTINQKHTWHFMRHRNDNQYRDDSQRDDRQGDELSKEIGMAELKEAMRSLWVRQTKYSSRGNSWVLAHRERLRLAYGFFEIAKRNDLATLTPSQLQYLQEKKSYPNFDNSEWGNEPIELLKDLQKTGDNTSLESEEGASSTSHLAQRLRKVILQDFAAMVASEINETRERRTSFNHIFAIKHPVLSSPAFREYATQLHHAMATESVDIRDARSASIVDTDSFTEDAAIDTLQVQENSSTLTATTTVQDLRHSNHHGEEHSMNDMENDQTNQLRRNNRTVDLTPATHVTQHIIDSSAQEKANEVERLTGEIERLWARLALLEGDSRDQSLNRNDTSATLSVLSTTTIPRLPAGINSQGNDADIFIERETSIGVDVDIEAGCTDDDNYNNSNNSNINATDRLWQENQELRNRLLALEMTNRELLEQNQIQQRQLSASHTPEPPILSTPSVPCSQNASVSQDDYTSNSHQPMRVTNSKLSNEHRSQQDSSNNFKTSRLRQEAQNLRHQLASLEREEHGMLDYVTVAIDSVEFLGNRVNQIEQSMHGLWAMIARNEAAKFAAAAGPKSPPTMLSSPSMAYSSPPLTPAIGVGAGAGVRYQHLLLQQRHQQQQQHEKEQRGSARFRMNTISSLPLRNGAVTSDISLTTSGTHGHEHEHGKQKL